MDGMEKRKRNTKLEELYTNGEDTTCVVDEMERQKMEKKRPKTLRLCVGARSASELQCERAVPLARMLLVVLPHARSTVSRLIISRSSCSWPLNY